MLSGDDPRHGTANAYCNLACRCASCRRANTLSRRAYIASVRVHARIVGRHGTSSAYNSGCRCCQCRAANTERSRRYRRDADHPDHRGVVRASPSAAPTAAAE